MKNKEIINYAKGLNASEEILLFIERVLKNLKDINISEFEHIIDYLLSDSSPKNLSRATYFQMRINAEKWNKLLQKKASKINENK